MKLGAAWIAIVLACACTGSRGSSGQPAEDAAPSDDVPTIPPKASCDATHDVLGPACAPRFTTCGGNETAKLGGGCLAVGVPKDACAVGFLPDGKGGCNAVLPTSVCPPGMLAVPGETTCDEIAPCGDAPYGDVVDGPTVVHVDASYGGASSDGSRSKPFTTIAPAIARAATLTAPIVAIAAGSYVENLVMDRTLQLVGRCPSKVSIKGLSGASDATTLAVRANGVSVRGLSIEGPGTAVMIQGAKDVTLDHVWVHDARAAGVWARTGATVKIIRAAITQNAEEGVLVSGATVSIEESRIDGTTVGAGGVGGVGVQVNPDPPTLAKGSVSLRRCVVERSAHAGVAALASDVTIEASTVRDGRGHTDGRFGIGILAAPFAPAKRGSTIVVRDSTIERNRNAGIVATSSSVTLDRSVVRDTALDVALSGVGIGIVGDALLGSTLVVRDAVVERNIGVGIRATGVVNATIERAIVRETRAEKGEGSGIAGLVVREPFAAPVLTLHDVLVADHPFGGVIAGGKTSIERTRVVRCNGFGLLVGGETTIGASLIETTRPDVEGRDGQGLIVNEDNQPKVTLVDVAILGAHLQGIRVEAGTVSARRVLVRDVAPTSSGGYGYGIAAIGGASSPTSLTLESVAIEQTYNAGLALYGVDANVTATFVADVRSAVPTTIGDGILALAVKNASGVTMPSRLEVRGALIERCARAGIGLFGSSLILGSTFLTCNAIDLDVERVASDGTPFEFTLDDRGGNTCGCGTFVGCRAQSSSLVPAPVPERTPKG